MNSWRASRPPGTGQHPPATPSLWKTSGEWDGAAAPAPPRPAALQPLPTPRGVSPLTPERYRGTISPPTAWDLPQHHHDGALAARHHHQPLPDHQSGRDDHAEVQHLVVQLGGGGGGKRGPIRLRGPVPGRAEPARCDPPGPGPTRFPTHTLPPPRFGTCRLFMRRTSSRKSSDSIASPDRGGCTARPAPLPLPAPLLPPPAASARRTAASGPAPSGRRQRGGRGGQGQGRRAGRHPWMLLFAILRSKHHSKARTPLRVK